MLNPRLLQLPAFVAVAMLSTLLQSCGSSGSNSTGASAPTPFSDPTDSTSLSAALITESRDNNNFDFWECAVTNSSARLAYRIFADNTGTETDLDNPAAISNFTWQATSAETLTTTVASTGTQNNFTDIRFSSKDNMTLVASENISLACERKSTQPEPEVVPPPSDSQPGLMPNTLSYGGVVYSLTHGFEESFRYSPSQFGDTHSTSDFDVADAEFKPTTLLSPATIIWRPNNASVWFRARLNSPGGDGFSSATFSFEPDSTDDNSPTLADKFFFQKGRFGVDIDENGSIDSEANEFLDITAGTITVTRLAEGARMSFDVTLSNGVTVTGSFEGVFVLFDNR